MSSRHDFRSFLTDALCATTTLAAGMARALSPNERRVAEDVSPSLEESRFWVMGRVHHQEERDIIAWSPVRSICKALAHLAVAFGMVDVALVDSETTNEEQIDRAA